MDKISIITINYNHAEGLKRTVRSVLSQTYRNIEYIIIDGGSTDSSMDVIRQNEEHIHYYETAKDNGIYDAINKGVARATGEWTLCLNSGDELTEKTTLERIFSDEIGQDVSVIYSDFWSATPYHDYMKCRTDRSKGVLLHQACIYRTVLHSRYGMYVVTQPYIVSDLLFLLVIPENEYQKTSHVICTYEYGGLSQSGLWSRKGALGLQVAFGLSSLNVAFMRLQAVRLTSMLPLRWKDFVRRRLLNYEYLRENERNI